VSLTSLFFFPVSLPHQTAIALILNNVFIQGLHTLTGAEILNVLSEHGTCTLVFSVSIMVLCFLCTLPRKLEHVALMGIASASEFASRSSVEDREELGRERRVKGGRERFEWKSSFLFRQDQAIRFQTLGIDKLEN